MIRHKLVQLGVSTEYIRTGDDLSTAESFVFSAPDGGIAHYNASRTCFPIFCQRRTNYHYGEWFNLGHRRQSCHRVILRGDCSVENGHYRNFAGSPHRRQSKNTTRTHMIDMPLICVFLYIQALLDMARKASVPSILDIDVSPSVAIDEARLGDMATLLACVRTADVLKPAMHAAVELLPHLDNSVTFEMAAAMSSGITIILMINSS